LTRTISHIEKYRQGNGVIQVEDEAGRPCSDLPIWVEQESHDFCFGCAAPNLDALPDTDQRRYFDRLTELFNQQVPLEGAYPVNVPDRIHLASLRAKLDGLAIIGRFVEVHVNGRTIAMTDLDERQAGRRLVDLYTLCFAHPAVRGIFWHGFRDGDPDAQDGGLLRQDFSPKAAYRVLQKLVDMIWHTRASGKTDAQGRFPFRGFFGTYRAVVMVGPKAQVATIPVHAEHNPAEPFLIKLENFRSLADFKNLGRNDL
jgi:hypothetical protein